MAKQRTLSRGELTAETTPAASNGMKRIIFVPKEIKIGQDQDQDQVWSGFRLMPPGEARAWWRHRVFRPTGRDPGTEKWRWVEERSAHTSTTTTFPGWPDTSTLLQYILFEIWVVKYRYMKYI